MRAIAALLALLAVTFSGSFGLHPFYDDWIVPSRAAAALRAGDVGAFLLSPIGYHWSPLWNVVALVNLQVAGWHSDLLIRALTLVVHGASLAWLFHLARRLGASSAAASLGMAVLALHHVGAAALYSFDTYAQMIVDLGTWVAGGLAYLALFCDGGKIHDRRLLLAAVLPLLGLLFKEQALAGVFAVCFLIAVWWWTANPPAAGRRRALALLALLLLSAAAFTGARRAAGAFFNEPGAYRFDSSGAYRLCLACVPINAGLIGGALVVPVRTMAVVDAWRSNPPRSGLLAAAAAAGGLLVGLVADGLRRRARRLGEPRTTAALVGLSAFSVFPVALLGRVGELHAHTAVFWLALLLALAGDEWRRAGQTPRARLPGGLLVAAYVASLAVGLRANLADMRQTGERAAFWLRQYDEAIQDLPPGSALVVRGDAPRQNPGDYSLYRITAPDLVMLMWVWTLRDLAEGYPTVFFEWTPWNHVERAALEARARENRLFELRRTAHGVEIARRNSVRHESAPPAQNAAGRGVHSGAVRDGRSTSR